MTLEGCSCEDRAPPGTVSIHRRLNALKRLQCGTAIFGKYEIPDLSEAGALCSGSGVAELSAISRDSKEKVRLHLLDTILAAQGNEHKAASLEAAFLAQAKLFDKERPRHAPTVLDYGKFGEALWAIASTTPPLAEDELLDTLRTKAKGSDPANDYSEVILDLLKSVLTGLSALHSSGISHRMISPASVRSSSTSEDAESIAIIGFSTSPGRFGHLDHVHAEFESTGNTMTPGFCAPELMSGRGDVSATVDVYSFGALAYFLASGEVPTDCPITNPQECTFSPHYVRDAERLPEPILLRFLSWLGSFSKERTRKSKPHNPVIRRAINTINGHIHDLSEIPSAAGNSMSALIMRCLKLRPQDRPANALEIAKLFSKARQADKDSSKP